MKSHSTLGLVLTLVALLAAGAGVNPRESLKGQTALMWAIAESHDEVAQVRVALYGLDQVARLLVAHGADLTIRNKKGETPLKIAEGTVNQAMLISHPSTAEVLRTLAAEAAARR